MVNTVTYLVSTSLDPEYSTHLFSNAGLRWTSVYLQSTTNYLIWYYRILT